MPAVIDAELRFGLDFLWWGLLGAYVGDSTSSRDETKHCVKKGVSVARGLVDSYEDKDFMKNSECEYDDKWLVNF